LLRRFWRLHALMRESQPCIPKATEALPHVSGLLIPTLDIGSDAANGSKAIATEMIRMRAGTLGFQFYFQIVNQLTVARDHTRYGNAGFLWKAAL
jgi:hypothetical protein